MAILTLEDLTGQCEAVVFTKEFAQCEELLKSERPLLFTGTVAIEDDENPVPKVRIREICALKDASTLKTSRVRFRLPVADLSPGRLTELRTILRRHRGKCVAFLHIFMPSNGPETVLKLTECVSYSEKVENEVDALFRRRVTEYS